MEKLNYFFNKSIVNKYMVRAIIMDNCIIL